MSKPRLLIPMRDDIDRLQIERLKGELESVLQDREVIFISGARFNHILELPPRPPLN